MKYTIKNFHKDYPSDDACLDKILEIRFGKVPVCPKCKKASKFHRISGRRQYSCQYCAHQIAPCAGTVFEKSRTSLHDWFYAMYLFTSTRHGVPAKELERQLGVTYKTAWRMAHKLRELMLNADCSSPLGGIVEIDETYVGGHRKMTHRHENRLIGKTPVLGMVERQGRVLATTLQSVTKNEIKPLVNRHVLDWAEIHTDEGKWYRYLDLEGRNHKRVNHYQKEYVNGNVHTNSIEGYWSRLKNSIKGTHIHVSKKYMNKYLSEFSFRYNSRQVPHLMFDRLVSGIAKPVVKH